MRTFDLQYVAPTAHKGEFLSLLDPPAEYIGSCRSCQQVELNRSGEEKARRARHDACLADHSL